MGSQGDNRGRSTTISGAPDLFGSRGVHRTASNSRNSLAPESPGHGTWVRTGKDSTGAEDEDRPLGFTFIVDRFDGGGNLIGTIKVRESFTLSETGDTYTSLGAFEFLDLQGNVIAPPGTATAQATRIKVEPL